MPVAMLPSLGLTPPAASMTKVKADLIVGQDGLTRRPPRELTAEGDLS